jgi:transglutaminase-like putative cysteine protease
LLPQDRFTLACQFLDELPHKIRQAVLSIPDKTVFKTSREDAERLAFYVGVMNPSILTDLDPSEARTRYEVIRPTSPPVTPRLEALRKRSRACYTRPRAKVERLIASSFN